MIRLIVEEGGKRRAFRLGEGVLTIGSGAAARLRVGAPDVAELHAELELAGGTARLRPRPGVLPPRLAGRPVGGETVLPLGQKVEIGAARLWIEDEAAPAAPAPPAPAAAPAPAARTEAEREARRRRAIEAARGAPRRSVVERTAPRVKKGLPAWAIVSIMLGIVGLVVILAWWAFGVAGEGALSVGETLGFARARVQEGETAAAAALLDGIAARELTAEERAEMEAIRGLIASAGQAMVSYAENEEGTAFRDNQLEKYEKLYLQGTVERAKARLFLKRCAEFRRRWPRHPEMDWVNRHEARYKSVVNFAEPPTLEDVLWEVRDCVDTMPRYYDRAFALLDEFAASAGGADLAAANARRAELIPEREAYAMDRLQQARYELHDRQSPENAIKWLVYSVCWLGDPALENDAARRLIQMSDLADHLKGYQVYRPAVWAELMENDIVRAEAARLGIR
ncbi:MAG: FHA domain-containing protein [Planctomycetota bacterium]